MIVIIYVVRKQYYRKGIPDNLISTTRAGPIISEPIVFPKKSNIPELIQTKEEIKVLVGIPIDPTNIIKIKTDDNRLRVAVKAESKSYVEIIDLPPEANTRHVKSSYRNGMLEITFKRK